MASPRSTTTTVNQTGYEVVRRPLRWPLAMCLVPLVGGLIETNERISDDLEGKARAALGDELVSVDFDAQDGEVCVLGDFGAARERLRGETGVVKVARAGSCAAEASAEPSTEPSATTQPSATQPSAAASTTAPPTPSTTAPATTEPAPADLIDVAGAAGEFSTLTGLLDAAGLTATLRGDGPFTLFAPTDAAFQQLDPALVDRLRNDPELLAVVLAHHVVGDLLPSADLVSGELDTLAGDTLSVDVGERVTISSGGPAPATVTQPDLVASNGVIHVIDTVLLPADLAAASALGVDALYDGSTITLTGVVDNEAQRQALVTGAIAAQGGVAERVLDQLTLAPPPAAGASVAAADAAASQLGALLATLPANFASGTASVTGTQLALDGLTLDQASTDAAGADAAAVGVDDAALSIEVRPQATAVDRDQLVADINALFVETSIQFDPGSASILAESNALLDRAASLLKQFDLSGITITIEGHTDGDGSDAANLALSQDRAEAVEAALVERGIDGDALDPVGFGETQPVAPNDTPANKALNRRVEFAAAQ